MLGDFQVLLGLRIQQGQTGSRALSDRDAVACRAARRCIVVEDAERHSGGRAAALMYRGQGHYLGYDQSAAHVVLDTLDEMTTSCATVAGQSKSIARLAGRHVRAFARDVCSSKSARDGCRTRPAVTTTDRSRSSTHSRLRPARYRDHELRQPAVVPQLADASEVARQWCVAWDHLLALVPNPQGWSRRSGGDARDRRILRRPRATIART